MTSSKAGHPDSMSQGHTATKFGPISVRVDYDGFPSSFNVYDPDGNYVTENSVERHALAEHVERCANSHAELVKALEALNACFDDEGNLHEQHQDQLSVALEQAESALALAKGGK